MDTIADMAPQFAKYAWFCYGAPTPLVGQGFTIPSEQGTQQGDVCGPLFFALTLRRLLAQLCADTAHAWARWFLDNGTLCGRKEDVVQVFQVICTHAGL